MKADDRKSPMITDYVVHESGNSEAQRPQSALTLQCRVEIDNIRQVGLLHFFRDVPFILLLTSTAARQESDPPQVGKVRTGMPEYAPVQGVACPFPFQIVVPLVKIDSEMVQVALR